MLFERVRRAAASGTAVVYITHRLAEVRELADRVTVLRDGKVRGVADGRRHHRRRAAGHDRRATAGVDLPAQADARRGSRRRARRRRAVLPGLLRRVLHGPPRGDHRGVGDRRQRPERRPSRPGRPRAVHRLGDARRNATIPARAAQAVGLPACRPASRGPDDDPLGAGERRPVGPGPVPLRGSCSTAVARRPPSRPSSPRSRSRRPPPRAWSPPSPVGTSRRSSWPGRSCPSRRSSWPTNPRRASTSGRGPRSTGSCARCPPRASRSSSPPPTPRSWKGSATGSSSCPAGHVVDDRRGRRRHRGAPHPRRRARHGPRRTASAARVDDLDAAGPVPQRRLRTGGGPRPGHARPRRLRVLAERPLPRTVQHHLGHDVLRRPGLHRLRADDRAASPAASTCPSARSPASSWSSAPSSSTRQVPARDGPRPGRSWSRSPPPPARSTARSSGTRSSPPWRRPSRPTSRLQGLSFLLRDAPGGNIAVRRHRR